MIWVWSRNMSGGSYYVPEKSRFPIFMAFSLFLLVMGASSFINNTSGKFAGDPDSIPYILYAGFGFLFLTMFFLVQNGYQRTSRWTGFQSIKTIIRLRHGLVYFF